MQLQIRGVPRSPERVFQLSPDQTGALLGRMEGDKNAGLAIPLPHIEQAVQGEPSTLCWSRKHLRFDYRDEAWTVTLLGKVATRLNEQELPLDTPTPIPANREVSLTCGDVSLRVFYSKLESEDPFATISIGGANRKPEVGANPFATITLAGRGPQAQAALQNAGQMERLSVDNLVSRTSSHLDVLRDEYERISKAVADMQQRRRQAEQARDEARIAIANVKQAPGVTELQSAMERVRTAAQRSQQALSHVGQSMRAVERSGDQAREIERATDKLAQDAASALSRIPAHDASGHTLKSKVDLARDDCHRRIGEIGALVEHAKKELEQTQVAARSAQDAEDEGNTISSRRESDFRRREQVLHHGRRYAIILAVLLSAALIGWLVGQFLQGSSSDPLEGISLLRLQGQQAA